MRVLEDVEHRLPLVAEPAVRLVQVAHDVDQGAPPFLSLAHAQPKLLDLLLESYRVAVRPRR